MPSAGAGRRGRGRAPGGKGPLGGERGAAGFTFSLQLRGGSGAGLPRTPRARWCGAGRRGRPGVRGRCPSREIPRGEEPVGAWTTGLTRGSRWSSPRPVEIYLAARAAAAAASGEAGGDWRSPGAHPLPGNDRSALEARPRPRRGRKGSAGRAGSGRAGRQVERGVLPRHRA